MADLPIDLPDRLGERLSRALDVEGKIPRALDALGPVADRDVLLLGGVDGIRARQLRELGARVTVAASGPAGFQAPADSADVVISLWSSFHGDAPTEVAEAERVLRPGGRLLVVHDYGRDDASHLRGDRPEYGAWSRRNGPFLGGGFKVRVLHCFWTFDSMEDLGEFLPAAFAQTGAAVAAGLKRPRLSYNVAIYHRTFGEAAEAPAAEAPAAGPPAAPAQAAPAPPAAAPPAAKLTKAIIATKAAMPPNATKAATAPNATKAATAPNATKAAMPPKAAG